MIGVYELLNRECKGKLMSQPKRHKTNRAVAQWQATTDEVLTEQGKVAIGSQFKAFETANFGWLVFAPDTKLTNGQTLEKRIYKY